MNSLGGKPRTRLPPWKVNLANLCTGCSNNQADKDCFLVLVDLNWIAMAVAYCTRVWDNKVVQQNLLAVALATIKKVVLTVAEHLAVGCADQPLKVMPVDWTEMPSQMPATEAGVLAMVKATV